MTLAYIGTVLLTLVILFVIGPLAALFGAFAGWATGLFFGNEILAVLQALGLSKDITMWQLGAAVGFFALFLRHLPTPSPSKDK
jgi:hypothetical protein